jgi:hypothetical protein
MSLTTILQTNRARWGAELDAAADLLGVEARVLEAVIAVECGEIPPAGSRPVIRLEVHVILRRTPPPAGIADVVQLRPAPTQWHRDAQWWRPPGEDWRRVHDGTQASEWAAFDAVAAIHEAAAIEATSWGIGQIMGWHWPRLGYPSAADFRAEQETVEGQIRVWRAFLASDRALVAALYARDFATFARLYNGPGQIAQYSAAIGAAFEAARSSGTS